MSPLSTALRIAVSTDGVGLFMLSSLIFIANIGAPECRAGTLGHGVCLFYSLQLHLSVILFRLNSTTLFIYKIKNYINFHIFVNFFF